MYKFYIRGIVQGVGFRPFIYNSCIRQNITGYVKNIGTGVVVDVDDKEKFLQILSQIPPQARIDSYSVTFDDQKFSDFKILESSGEGYSEIPADIYMCKDCLKELNDKDNRRYKYFFITCTNCGPRFSITNKNPYDRINTSMQEYEMCDKCKEEYTNPKNRRYHAQTIACHECGPKLFLKQKDTTQTEEVVFKTSKLLKDNAVVAVKGIGGFHLVCRTVPEAVKKLRDITGRSNKPYAVMCKDISMVEDIAQLNNIERELLLSEQRPIVVLKSKKSYPDVTELDTIGVMLPYTALHYLLFDYIDEPLVMTSSNYPDQPITIDDSKQLTENILTHDRIIENPIDDSVIKVINSKPLFLRRSRGYVPGSITLNENIVIKDKKNIKILSMGAELNNTFAIYNNESVTLSQYIGNTSNNDTLNNYKTALDKFLKFTHTIPDVILCDAHPEYNTNKYAFELSKKINIPLVKIQHHKAHAYSVAAEYGLTDFAAIICDGLGYGDDGNIWGGEIFHNNKRVGHLEEQYQLGGDSATITPSKMLFSILKKFLDDSEIETLLLKYHTAKELQIMHKQFAEKFNCPITTSCGRILDAAASLLDLCNSRTYDGRPAMVLEAHSSEPYDFEPVIENDILMTTPLFKYLVENIHKDKSRLAATVQHYIAQGMYAIASKYSKSIIFSGGCAYNNIITKFMIERNVFINTKVPSGDGGISFGQISYYLSHDN
jgi:hydrogenase maturation protein HypF